MIDDDRRRRLAGDVFLDTGLASYRTVSVTPPTLEKGLCPGLLGKSGGSAQISNSQKVIARLDDAVTSLLR
ncbi:MAG: hypothetical protein LBT86_04285 [Deltaproteobacteria bacterium]|jgi:hypothetical protein|nr:hypothetical protein [Deltaproteobacteria bacterium]